jgi:hypothetical protein
VAWWPWSAARRRAALVARAARVVACLLPQRACGACACSVTQRSKQKSTSSPSPAGSLRASERSHARIIRRGTSALERTSHAHARVRRSAAQLKRAHHRSVASLASALCVSVRRRACCARATGAPACVRRLPLMRFVSRLLRARAWRMECCLCGPPTSRAPALALRSGTRTAPSLQCARVAQRVRERRLCKSRNNCARRPAP